MRGSRRRSYVYEAYVLLEGLLFGNFGKQVRKKCDDYSLRHMQQCGLLEYEELLVMSGLKRKELSARSHDDKTSCIFDAVSIPTSSLQELPRVPKRKTERERQEGKT